MGTDHARESGEVLRATVEDQVGQLQSDRVLPGGADWHIVRIDKIRLFNAVNIEQGYKPLTIYSPREVISYATKN